MYESMIRTLRGAGGWQRPNHGKDIAAEIKGT